MPQNDERKAESGDDVDMEDSESRVHEDGGATPLVTVEPPEGSEDKMEVDN
jgi:hypothetical protein